MAALSYEKAFEKLNTITNTLTEGNLPLEKTMALYEEAISLCAYCEQKLKEAKLKVSEWEGGKENEAVTFDD